MQMRILAACVTLLTVSVVARAQSGAGTWVGKIEGRGGGGIQVVTVVLNSDGTGTFKQGSQDEEDLSEVTFDGDSVSFNRTPNSGGRGGGRGGFNLSYSGEVNGDTLTLEVSNEGRRGGRGGGRGGFQFPTLVLTRQ